MAKKKEPTEGSISDEEAQTSDGERSSPEPSSPWSCRFFSHGLHHLVHRLIPGTTASDTENDSRSESEYASDDASAASVPEYASDEGGSNDDTDEPKQNFAFSALSCCHSGFNTVIDRILPPQPIRTKEEAQRRLEILLRHNTFHESFFNLTTTVLSIPLSTLTALMDTLLTHGGTANPVFAFISGVHSAFNSVINLYFLYSAGPSSKGVRWAFINNTIITGIAALLFVNSIALYALTEEDTNEVLRNFLKIMHHSMIGAIPIPELFNALYQIYSDTKAPKREGFINDASFLHHQKKYRAILYNLISSACIVPIVTWSSQIDNLLTPNSNASPTYAFTTAAHSAVDMLMNMHILSGSGPSSKNAFWSLVNSGTVFIVALALFGIDMTMIGLLAESDKSTVLNSLLNILHFCLIATILIPQVTNPLYLIAKGRKQPPESELEILQLEDRRFLTRPW